MTARPTTVSGVKVVDDNTVALTISAPNADYFAGPDRLHVVHHARARPQGRGSEDARDSSAFATTSPIGTGPYKFIKYETDQYSQFEANPDYFKGPAKIKNIFVKRLTGDAPSRPAESGELDLSVRLNPAEKARPREGPHARRPLDTGRRHGRPLHEPAHRHAT